MHWNVNNLQDGQCIKNYLETILNCLKNAERYNKTKIKNSNGNRNKGYSFEFNVEFESFTNNNSMIYYFCLKERT